MTYGGMDSIATFLRKTHPVWFEIYPANIEPCDVWLLLGCDDDGLWLWSWLFSVEQFPVQRIFRPH